jgi:hypothetical protein
MNIVREDKEEKLVRVNGGIARPCIPWRRACAGGGSSAMQQYAAANKHRKIRAMGSKRNRGV